MQQELSSWWQADGVKNGRSRVDLRKQIGSVLRFVTSITNSIHLWEGHNGKSGMNLRK